MAARSRSLIALLIVIAVIFGLTLIRRWRTPSTLPHELFPYGELRIGVDPSNPPFAVITSTDLFGLEVDLGKELGKRLDLTVRFVLLGFDGLYDSLKTDQVDALIAGLMIDYSQLESIHYSQPYFDAGLLLISDRGVDEMSELPGHSLAYPFGSDADAEARLWLRRTLPFETKPYELPRDALDAVRLGEADAALVDAISTRLYLNDHPDWRPDYHYVRSAHYSIATQSRRPEITTAIQDALQAIIDDGTLDQIINRWL